MTDQERAMPTPEVGPTPGTDPGGRVVVDGARWRALAWLAVAMLLAMTTWFSATAVLPQLRVAWQIGPAAASMLTIAVQIGFVLGAVASAALSMSDVIPPRRLMAGGAVGASLTNLGLLVVDTSRPAIALRLFTGVFLAGVYPPALKAMSTWFRTQRGTALGVMVGALTVGSAAPHMINAVGGLDWQTVVVASSILTVTGGLIAVTLVDDGPFPFPRVPFEPRAAMRVLSDRRVRLASYGYFGHMWELYAMWAWVGAFVTTSFEARGVSAPGTRGAWVAFAAIGIGGAGAVVGGLLADRTSRTFATSVAMIASGASAAVVGLAWAGPPAVVVAAVLFWGFWVVADSAQFSTIVSEVADQRYVGTAMTLQLALGFVLTVVTIWLIPVLVEIVGWRWAFLALVPGPIVGTAAMRGLERETAQRGARDP